MTTTTRSRTISVPCRDHPRAPQRLATDVDDTVRELTGSDELVDVALAAVSLSGWREASPASPTTGVLVTVVVRGDGG